MEEIEFSRRLFEGRLRKGKNQTWVQAQVKYNFASSSCCVFTDFEFFIKL